MAIQRMDNVGIIVENLDTVIAFFVELGMELQGRMHVSGDWVDRTIGLENVRVEMAMLRTPDGKSAVELSQFENPPVIHAQPKIAPVNTLGIRRIMFAVDDIDADVARMQAAGAELMGEITQYENTYRLCYLRGPEGIMVALAQKIGGQ